jgi:uncharacterized protein with HEPN domain
MKRTDDVGRFQHMLDHAQEAIDMARGKTRADLDVDRKLNLALVRLLEIIGEAAARVSVAGQQTLPQVPWSAIIGLRNRLIHGYDEVDLDILWDIIQVDLPPLVAQLQQPLSQRKPADSSDGPTAP